MRKIIFTALYIVSLLVFGCSQKVDPKLTDKGVSKELAQMRYENYSDLIYNVEFTIPENKIDTVFGESVITFKLKEKQNIIIDFMQSADAVKSVKVNGKSADYIFDNEHIIVSKSYAETGENIVEVAFAAGNTSLNRNTDYMYTLLVPDRCRTLMPCFDQPDLKAKFILTLNIPSKWEAASNGAIRSVEENDSRKVLTFNQTALIPTYLFAFAAGEFFREDVDVNGRTIGILHRERNKEKRELNIPIIASEVERSLSWMENYTGIAHPFDNYTVVAIPTFQYGGMEHPGAIMYKASTLFLEKDAGQNEQMSRTSLIAHETAHLWFGDLVTMKWFDDVWMKEVFAGFMADKITKEIYPELNHKLSFYLKHFSAALAVDRTKGANPIIQELDNLNNAGTLYGGIIYSKSPIVMDMLERMLGEETLRGGLSEYLKTYSYSNATWDQLIGILDSLTEKDLKTWSNIWVKEPDAPIIEVVDAEQGKTKLVMRDPKKSGRVWNQTTGALVLRNGNLVSENIVIENGESNPVDGNIIIPDADAIGYGVMLPNNVGIDFLCSKINTIEQPLHRAVAWSLLNESMLNGKVDPKRIIEAVINQIDKENDERIENRANSLITSAYNRYLADSTKKEIEPIIEKYCRQRIDIKTKPSEKKTYYSMLLNIHSNPQTTEWFKNILYGKTNIKGIELSDNDKVSLVNAIVLRDNKFYDEGYQYIKSIITDKDIIEKFEFIYPAVGDKTMRDTKFYSFMDAKNRRNESWTQNALGLLFSSQYKNQSKDYIPHVLNKLLEVQQTGDIFFPAAWISIPLASQNDIETLNIVEKFMTENPDYPKSLKLKILQAADHLYRLNDKVD